MRTPEKYIFIILLSVALNLSADDIRWKVGVAGFSGENLSLEYRYLTDSIPMELFESIKNIKAHFLSEREKELLGSKKKDEKILALKKDLSKLLRTRDMFFFGIEGPSDGINDVKEKIKNKRKELDMAEAEGVSLFEQDSIPVELVDDGTKTGIIKGKEVSVDVVGSLKGYDQLVFGELEKIDRWLYFSVYSYNYLTGEKIDIFSTLIEPKEINSAVGKAVTETVKIVSGSNPPVLLVTGKPEDAFFSVDNGPNNIAGYPVPIFSPGNHKIRIHRKGYLSEERTVDIFEGKSTEVNYKLSRVRTGFAVVSSVPSGADVYLDSEWVGKTPVILEDPVLPSYLSIMKEGFTGKNSIIDNRERNYIFIMDPEKVNLNDIQEKRRRHFYNSLGAFVISIAVPVISYGISSEYGYAYNTSILTSGISSSETDRLMSVSNSWYNLYLGGVFISASLFINMAVNLNSYISLY